MELLVNNVWVTIYMFYDSSFQEAEVPPAHTSD